jgi:hypothetical protein
MSNHLRPRSVRSDQLQPSQIVREGDLAVRTSRHALSRRGRRVRDVPQVTAADDSETEDDNHRHAAERERGVALPAPAGATACLLDQRLLVTQPFGREAVAEIARARRARRGADSHSTIVIMTLL